MRTNYQEFHGYKEGINKASIEIYIKTKEMKL